MRDIYRQCWICPFAIERRRTEGRNPWAGFGGMGQLSRLMRLQFHPGGLLLFLNLASHLALMPRKTKL